MNIKNYGLGEKYEELLKSGDRLAEMEKLVDWEAFRHMLTYLYRNNTESGGTFRILLNPVADPNLKKPLFKPEKWLR